MARVMEVALDVMDRPWEWGEADCCTSACEVFLRIHGVDPMAHLRGTYKTKTGAMRMIASFGGFVPMVRALAAKAGLVESAAVPGAIGATQDSLVICARPCVWLGKTPHGLAATATPLEVMFNVAR
jgi:hypothetical protein